MIHHCVPDSASCPVWNREATLYDMNCDIDNLGVETVWHRMKAWNKPLRDKIPVELAAIYERELNGFRQRQPMNL